MSPGTQRKAIIGRDHILRLGNGLSVLIILDITKKLGKFSDIVRNPQYVCTKCGRVADQKKWLHKPAALK
jgi:hypothetical protein